jgi:tetratricopeptide (TPR) repeat protein
MIVKDEATIITRCLTSLRPLISTWVIVDTGSTDGTQDIIRQYLADLPGELHERPWRDFGTNRSEALALARDKADYTLMMDADDELTLPPSFTLPPLDQDAYQLLLSQGRAFMYRTQIFRAALPWRYEGVLHEYPTCGQKVRQAKLKGPVVQMHVDGARAADPGRFSKDARVLEEALAREPDNRRYAFYLAQSYRDAGQLEQAIVAYEKRVSMGGGPEEVWYSLFQVAELSARLSRPAEQVIARFLAAFDFRPTRAESLCQLAYYCRLKGRHASAYLFARAAAEIPMPDDSVCVDASVYLWRARDELAMAAQSTGRRQEAVRVAQAILASGKLPPSERARVERLRSASGGGPGAGGSASCT